MAQLANYKMTAKKKNGKVLAEFEFWCEDIEKFGDMLNTYSCWPSGLIFDVMPVGQHMCLAVPDLSKFKPSLHGVMSSGD